MKRTLSIKRAWYGLILLVAFLPFLILLSWGSLVFHDILFEKELEQEQTLRTLVQNNVTQEIARLITTLENKSDPMAYTLSHQQDVALLDALLKKVLSRESAIHLLLLLKPDGSIIKAREIYDQYGSDNPAIMQHLNDLSASSQELMVPMQGKVFVGSTRLHPEGVFFTIAVPVKIAEKPQAVLVAMIDANILWRDLKSHMSRESVSTYIIDAQGHLLVAPDQSQYLVSDDVTILPLVKSVTQNRPWDAEQSYQGLQGKQVYGSSVQIKHLGWYIITEIEKQHLLQPIQDLLLKLSMAAVVIMLFFIVLGMLLLGRVVNAIRTISNDFERISKQDFMPSTIRSSFTELDSMVKGFNHMARDIARKQQSLNQAAIVFENTSEGIMITDAQARIVTINNAFTEITGYSEEEVTGKKPSVLRSGQHDKAFYQKMWQALKESGHWRGEIQNRRKDGEVYTELLSINSFKGEYDEVLQYIGVFTDISNIKETEHKLEYLALHDPLTDLPNRLLCNARLEHELQSAQRNNQLVAIMFLDLDMFKNINDSLGHVLGDQLLQKVTARMQQHIRNKDTLARHGGDEFVLIVGSLSSRQDAAHFAENILQLFSDPFLIGEQEVFIGVSIGISIFPEDTSDAETILRNADAAMYRAKSEGRNNFQFYTEDLTSNAYQRLNMETYLRRALEKNELVLHYQPQYSLLTGRVIAAEALLRWQHPESGLLYPDKFISLAEETGLIVPIGEWVIETACKQVVEWENAGCPSLRMAINLSARQFWKPGLAKIIHAILIKNGLRPERLDFELTESIIMRDTQITIETLNELHEMGVELSIDDFGTGYSSLSYLKRFPINRLKIDRSFVSDINTNKNDADMINSIIALGHCLNLEVLAEGVETREQLIYLHKHGCNEAQGYYYSRPVPADEFAMLCKVDDCRQKSQL